MKILRQAKVITPLIIFAIIFILLWRGLSLRPNLIPSPLIGKPIPTFQLPDLFNNKKFITRENFLGHVILLNVWATWCEACNDEHENLLTLARNSHITFYGLDYKDNSTTAKAYLQKHGNPYQLIAVDQDGNAALDWGVYGTPETFIIDKKGIIQYKHIGPITNDDWQQILLPIVTKLQSEKL